MVCELGLHEDLGGFLERAEAARQRDEGIAAVHERRITTKVNTNMLNT
jgi:hypothetical protein